MSTFQIRREGDLAGYQGVLHHKSKQKADLIDRRHFEHGGENQGRLAERHYQMGGGLMEP
jgi:hypothetical protein